MATYTLPTPFGIADDETGGTTIEDMQRIIASKYEVRTSRTSGRRGIVSHPGPDGDGNGVELRPDETLRVHEGVVVLDLSSFRCVEAVVPYVSAIEPGIPVGQAGRVIVSVTPPVAGENDAQLTTTTTEPPRGSVILEILKFPSGWKTTSQATRDADLIYATPRGAGGGMLSSAVDADTAVRNDGGLYRRLHQSFVVSTDAHIRLDLLTTTYGCSPAGAPVGGTAGITGAIEYAVFLDGVLLTSVERTITGFRESKFLSVGAAVLAGRHEVHVESRSTDTTAPGDEIFWRVGHGGARQHPGDRLTVRHEGVRG